MTDRELMTMALEALELEDMACRYEKDPTPSHIANAITALRERLAQPNEFNPDWDAMAVMVEEQQPAALHRVMCTPPDWAIGLPLEAEVNVMKRYGK